MGLLQINVVRFGWQSNYTFNVQNSVPSALNLMMVSIGSCFTDALPVRWFFYLGRQMYK